MKLKNIILAASCMAAISATASAAVINEVSVSHDLGSSDFPFFFELVGIPGEDLTSKSLVVVSQNTSTTTGTILTSVSLSGSIGANGTYLIANDDAGTVRDTADIFGVTPDAIAGAIPGDVNLGRSFAVVLMDDADIPGMGAGPLTGSEPVEDGFDFDGDGRDAAPLVFAGVPTIAPDAGYAAAGFVRNTDGVDTDDVSDITIFQYDTDNVTSPGEITTGSVIASPTPAAQAVINEASVSHDLGGDDFPYFYEIFGTPGLDLSGLTLAIVGQNTTDTPGTVIDTIPLTGSIGANGFYLVGNNDAGTTADVFDIYLAAPDDLATVPSPLNLGRSFAVLLLADSEVQATFTGTEIKVDGFDFDGDSRDGAPLAFDGVPTIAPDGGYAAAGFVRNADGVDTDDISDITIFQFVVGAVTNPADITTGSTQASPQNAASNASVEYWHDFD